MEIKMIYYLVFFYIFFLNAENAFASDIIFSSHCLENVISDIDTNSDQTNPAFYLQMIGNRARFNTSQINELLPYTKVKFPSGDVVDMVNSPTIESEDELFELKCSRIDWGLNAEELDMYKSLYKINGSKLMSRSEFAALNMYKSSKYRNINSALTYMDFKDAEDEKSFIKIIKYINSALERIPPYRGYVKRLASFAPEVLENFKPGTYFSNKSYFSSTLNNKGTYSASLKENVAWFIIKSLKGRPIEDKLIDGVSQFEEEAEVLFKPQSIFKVLKVEKGLHPNGNLAVTKIFAVEM